MSGSIDRSARVVVHASAREPARRQRSRSFPTTAGARSDVPTRPGTTCNPLGPAFSPRPSPITLNPSPPTGRQDPIWSVEQISRRVQPYIFTPPTPPVAAAQNPQPGHQVTDVVSWSRSTAPTCSRSPIAGLGRRLRRWSPARTHGEATDSVAVATSPARTVVVAAAEVSHSVAICRTPMSFRRVTAEPGTRDG